MTIPKTTIKKEMHSISKRLVQVGETMMEHDGNDMRILAQVMKDMATMIANIECRIGEGE
jgi:hypothetical protein